MKTLEKLSGLARKTLKGRDDLYTHLLTQEFGFWYAEILENGRIDPKGVDLLVTRRGFNKTEASRFRGFVNQMNRQAKALILEHKIETFNTLDRLRRSGWTVAVHNDYRFRDRPHTFWLMTRGTTALKGEGLSDLAALIQIAQQAQRLPLQRAEKKLPEKKLLVEKSVRRKK